MKSFLALSLVALSFASTLAYAGNFHRNASGKESDIFTPTVFYVYSSTKADKTHSTTASYAIRFRASAASTYRLNGSGAAVPLDKDAWEGPMGTGKATGAGRDINSFVFSVTSSATKTKIYIQEQ